MKNQTPAALTAEEFDAITSVDAIPVLVNRDIPSDAVEIAEARVRRLANRAAKKGFPKPILVLGPTFPKTRTAPDGSDYTVEYQKIAIVASGKMAVAGWHLVAVIAPIVQNGATVGVATTVPGETATFGQIEDWNRCDHCNAHRQRNETFVVANESGEQKQIGRQCLRDFLGHDPSSLISWLDATWSLVSDEDVESWGSGAARMYQPSDIIAGTARIVAATGRYVSRAKAEIEGIEATGDAVWEFLAPANGEMVKEFDRDFPFGPKSEALREATLRANALLVASDKPADNDWVASVKNVVGADWVQRRHVGIVASSVILGQRLLEREAKETADEARKAERIASGARDPQHVGTVGARLMLDLTVEFARTFEGNYGTTTLIKFRTAEGDLVQWFASGEWDVEPGQHLRLTGTVKAHEADRYSKEPVTLITRCKVA